MTLEEIDAMQAGPEMDALVAETVMGCKISYNHGGDPYCNCSESHPHNRFWDEICDDLLADYSERIAAAWEVVEKLATLDFDIELTLSSKGPHDDPERYYCGVQYGDDNAPWKPEFRYCQIWASTAPLAICRAALKAVVKP